ncbi:MAG TPA: ABC transporter ATP-binding protein [Plantibacter sp.]|uniref:ABC transporter ATP-binding protein n=1 Tax=Plantibacter sp. TaxID=1871045 RepID=UPI002D02AB92|nr:ABC transporter ATP-binding protein [Plantibacter sp.]
MSFEEVRFDRVARAFGETDALADLTLTIRTGEFVAFLGPSGSGKSTALNCLAGLLTLTDGSISLDDRRIDHLPPERRGFAMVFQNYALFPHMSVRRNVEFGLQMRRVSKAKIGGRVDDALKLVKLEHHAEKFPGQLSGGEQQRVAIARAIATEPPLVLMDEPLSNLDAQLRLEMRTEIRRLHQELELTTVYVTHDQQEAMSLADRMVVLRNGRVQQIGTPEEIYASPSTSFVASFMGYRNIFPARVARQQDGRVTISADGVELNGIAAQGTPTDDVIVAVRPEDVRVVHGTDIPDGNRVDLEVEVVEYGGREYTVGAVTSAGLLFHLLTDQPLRVGERISVAIPVERVRVYPAATSDIPAGEDMAAGELEH